MRRAFTLAELLIALSLGFLLTLLLARVLVGLMRQTGSAVERLELVQVAHAISQRIVDDLQTAPPHAILLPDSSSRAHSFCFSIQSLERVTATAKPVYSPQLIVYQVEIDRGRISRRVCQPTEIPLDRPTLWSPNQLQREFEASKQPARILAAGLLQDFQLTLVPSEQATILELQLLLQLHGKSFRHRETVALRNGR